MPSFHRNGPAYLGVWRFVAALIVMSISTLATAGEMPGTGKLVRNNLVVEGKLENAVLVQIKVSAPDLKKPIVFNIPILNGVLQEGIAVPAGKERIFAFQAFDAKGAVMFKGNTVQSVHDELNKPFGLQLKSGKDGSKASITMASHRVGIDVMATRRKAEAFTQLVASVYDADGRALSFSADDIRWEINDPWIKEHAMPCKGSNGPPPPCIEFLPRRPGLTSVAMTACFKEVFCRQQLIPPTPPIWRSVTVGLGHHACALGHDKTAYCWGQGEHGQLGVDVPKDCQEIVNYAPPTLAPWGCSKNPVKVQCPSGTCNFVDISAGFKHTCAIDQDQDAWCWGSNPRGELGLGYTNSAINGDWHPQRVIGGLKFTAISAGAHFTCALATDHNVYCWGENTYLNAGNTPGAVALSPAKVNLLGIHARTIDAGWAHACAVVEQGRLYCWGANAENVLGSDSFVASPLCGNCPAAPRLMQFADIPGLVNKVVDLASAGMHSSCAHVTSGETVCWGRRLPVLPVTNSLSHLAVGGAGYCGIISGNALCAGQGKTGILGDGSTVFSVRGPVAPLRPPTIFRNIDVGNVVACGISGDDKLYCWGSNHHGALGNGSLDDNSVPIPVKFIN